MKSNLKIGFYFPGWTRKSITFSIDDGDIPNDRKFLDIVRPAGILGTFNISSPTRTTVEEYRELYRGYEIANHCANHPLLFLAGQKYTVANEPYTKENCREYTEEDPVIYKHQDEGIYLIVNKGIARKITDRENYLRFAKENRVALEEIFGEGSIKGFVWPYGERKDELVYRGLCDAGYSYMRCGRTVLPEKQDFNIPEDKTHWRYTANHSDLLSAMEIYENHSDDGNLKMFMIGVHARDYERNGKWGDLCEFVKKYANRPNDYYYATNIDIIEYEAAVKGVLVVENLVENPSERDIYMTIFGERVILKAKSSLKY